MKNERTQIIEKLNSRILEISKKHNLSHLGSCFTSLPIIFDIFQSKSESDKFVLSNGHAGLALYVVLEYFKNVDAEHLLETYGIHPERDLENFIDVSTGSLGLGITIATGLAIGNPNINVYCLISDGETAEGSIWESLRFIDENNISNIFIHANINGWAAYKSINTAKLAKQLSAFLPSINIHFTNNNDVISFNTPLEAHYINANLI